MMFWKVDQDKKKKGKNTTMNTTTLGMENEEIYQVFPKISNFSPGIE